MKDPIVEEIREFRFEHASKFNFNLYEICKDLKKKEKDCGHVLVNFSAKKYIPRLHLIKTVSSDSL